MPHRTDVADRRGLILDFAGVLTASPIDVHRAWCVSEGLAPGAWRSTLNDHPEGRRLYAALEIGEIGQAEWNEGTAALLGAHVDPVNLMGRAWARVPVARRMVALARAARAAGHRLALLSNSFGLDPFNPYEHVGIWDLFDVHVVSELVGMAKPDPAIYELALERIGLPAERCAFVDDHAVNLPPAADLGIATVHVTDEDEAVKSWRPSSVSQRCSPREPNCGLIKGCRLHRSSQYCPCGVHHAEVLDHAVVGVHHL